MEIFVRASIVFFFLLLLTRGMKKRTLGDMAPFEMILLVTLGDIVQQGVTQEDMSITGSILAVSTFGFWITALSWLTWRFRRVGRIVDGVPVVIVQDGRPIDQVLKVERLPLDEVHEAARQDGIDDLAKVRLAVLEPSGRISFIKAD
jgi:uncharacterized membrane protein YcaP (DUF421 family)